RPKELPMNSIKYIGMDVHSATTSIAVRNDAGKLIMETTVETQAATVVDCIEGVRGTLHVALEEGIHAGWLYELPPPLRHQAKAATIAESRRELRPAAKTQAGVYGKNSY
ncbi:MAG: hypothetical protein KGM47_13565, partial [Acidobacteriota bacterium]|nr:hypothetical protein [Acidobacteriota bacterium]